MRTRKSVSRGLKLALIDLTEREGVADGDAAFKAASYRSLRNLAQLETTE
jgi:hypothetical protein